MARTPQAEHTRCQLRAAELGLAPPPERPALGECCERGCDPCIWDYYERALLRWRERTGIGAAGEGGA